AKTATQAGNAPAKSAKTGTDTATKARTSTKSAAAKSERVRGRAKKSASSDAPNDVKVVADEVEVEEVDELDGEPDIEGEPGEEIDLDTEDLNLDDLEDEPAVGDADTDAEVDQT